MKESDISYITGLFDGEGCVQYKQGVTPRKNHLGRITHYKEWRITMEMSMTDAPVIRWVHKTLGVGTVRLNVKNKSPSSKPYWKDQLRWRCSFKDAYYVACLMYPYARVKKEKMKKIIEHYKQNKHRKTPKVDNIINLNQYKEQNVK